MEPDSYRLRHRGLIADVGRFGVDEFQRPLRWRLEIERRNEPAGVLLQHHEARVRICAIKFAAGASTQPITLAQSRRSGSQQIVPQVVKTRSNGPGASCAAWSTLP